MVDWARIKERITSLYSSNKEEINIPVEWKSTVEKKATPEVIVREGRRGAGVVEELRSRLPRWEPIHVPISMKIRRIVTFLLLISFCLSAIGSVQALVSSTSLISLQYAVASLLVSAPTAIILLDYLFKTRALGERTRKKWYLVEEEDADANTK
jgi:hypothetical protein